MKPGTKPTPTALKLIKGNPGKRTINRDEPKPESKAPPMPAVLDSVGQEHWNYLVSELEKMGTLASSDMGVIAMAACAYSRWYHAEETLNRYIEKSDTGYIDAVKTSSGILIQNAVVGISNAAAKALVKYCSELGLTPSSRTRVHIEKPVELTRRERLLS